MVIVALRDEPKPSPRQMYKHRRNRCTRYSQLTLRRLAPRMMHHGRQKEPGEVEEEDPAQMEVENEAT